MINDYVDEVLGHRTVQETRKTTPEKHFNQFTIGPIKGSILANDAHSTKLKTGKPWPKGDYHLITDELASVITALTKKMPNHVRAITRSSDGTYKESQLAIVLPKYKKVTKEKKNFKPNPNKPNEKSTETVYEQVPITEDKDPVYMHSNGYYKIFISYMGLTTAPLFNVWTYVMINELRLEWEDWTATTGERHTGWKLIASGIEEIRAPGLTTVEPLMNVIPHCRTQLNDGMSNNIRTLLKNIVEWTKRVSCTDILDQSGNDAVVPLYIPSENIFTEIDGVEVIGLRSCVKYGGAKCLAGPKLTHSSR
jgi:hypothetical protein